MKQIVPGSTLGILGGGQLGRMFTFEAKRLGYRVVTLDPTPDCPCGQVADEHIVADYIDQTALQKLSEMSDVITYEFENIDAGAVEFLEGLGKPVYPSSHVLRISQDRLLEKEFLHNAGLGVAGFKAIHSLADITNAMQNIGLPAVIKTVKGGYDGKGQAVVTNENEAIQAFHTLHKGQPLIWEKKISFLKELSVIACRGIGGRAVAYPVSENIHVQNILDTGIVPARIPEQTQNIARSMAIALGEKLGIIGVYCLELFMVSETEILVNEIAPRPHNSGHYTLDAAVCSQFEQQVRAICGLPLGSTAILKSSVMVNLIGNGAGNTLKGVELALEDNELSLHLYGKPIASAKRKMGHFTVVSDTIETALSQSEHARSILHWG